MATVYQNGAYGATGGYVYVPEVSTTVTTASNAITSSYYSSALSWGNVGTVADSKVAQALFTLKPAIKKKYKGDTAKFISDLLDAADRKRKVDAFDRIDRLLDIEE